MTEISRRATVLGLASACTGLCAPAVFGQSRPVIKASSLLLPVFNPIVWNIMKDRGFDAKNGFDLDARPYPSISAFYAAFATGETDVLIGGPTVLQKLYLEGVPVRIVATGFTLSDLVIFARDPAIKSLADLKGKQVAMDMGSSQYQIVSIWAAAKGLKLGQDIIVVNANFATARAQLEAGRVEAALVIEPIASIILKQNPDWRIIFKGDEAWKEVAGSVGWEVVAAMRADSIQRMPDAPKRLLVALQDTASFVNSDTAAADKIAADTVKLPPGILTAAVQAKRFEFNVQAASGPERKTILDMMDRSVKAGFNAKMPDEAIIHVL
jgi:NitT/TauT family transport system substrate-binding protein